MEGKPLVPSSVNTRRGLISVFEERDGFVNAFLLINKKD